MKLLVGAVTSVAVVFCIICWIGVFWLTAGCGSPCQQVKATRCNAQIVEACGSNNKWQRVLDCTQVKPTSNTNALKDWVCRETGQTGHTCVPKK